MVTLVSSTNKAIRHDIIEILLKVALNTIVLALSLRCTLLGVWSCQKAIIANVIIIQSAVIPSYIQTLDA